MTPRLLIAPLVTIAFLYVVRRAIPWAMKAYTSVTTAPAAGFVVALIFFSLLAAPVCGEDFSGPSGKNSLGKKCPDRHLYLYEKDPATWLVIKNGAWGKITFNECSSKFVLNAHGLVPHTAYALIRATGPRPYAHVVARGTTDNKGDLHLRGSWPEWTLRFWVVKGDDVMGKAGDFGPGSLDPFKAWNPEYYLFEAEVL